MFLRGFGIFSGFSDDEGVPKHVFLRVFRVFKHQKHVFLRVFSTFSGRVFGTLFGPHFWCFFKPFWLHLGPLWGPCWSSGAPCGSPLALLGLLWAPLGLPLGSICVLGVSPWLSFGSPGVLLWCPGPLVESFAISYSILEVFGRGFWDNLFRYFIFFVELVNDGGGGDGGGVVMVVLCWCWCWCWSWW